MEKLYYVYMITNYTNSTLYIGVTNNLYRRLDENTGKRKPMDLLPIITFIN
ncbi:GIY-YIG nuclease family protein [Anaerococcus octavius]|uniref:GIY-YIG nuclease family protein n=1 Tax=Anaerococcus octavius TaxID=54007 RepID=UPI003B5B7999